MPPPPRPPTWFLLIFLLIALLIFLLIFLLILLTQDIILKLKESTTDHYLNPALLRRSHHKQGAFCVEGSRTRRPEEEKMSYANILDVSTSGASWQTAQHVGVAGVTGSHKIAEIDSRLMEKYRSNITSVGRQFGVDPALIAAIISRESSAGATLQEGWGDNRKAWGLMQVDVTPNGGNHKRRGNWDSREHLCQGTEILVYFIGRIQNNFPRWSPEQQLKGGIAAYNTGDRNIHEGRDVDASTFGRDYSNDVVARAQYYKNKCGY